MAVQPAVGWSTAASCALLLPCLRLRLQSQVANSPNPRPATARCSCGAGKAFVFSRCSSAIVGSNYFYTLHSCHLYVCVCVLPTFWGWGRVCHCALRLACIVAPFSVATMLPQPYCCNLLVVLLAWFVGFAGLEAHFPAFHNDFHIRIVCMWLASKSNYICCMPQGRQQT